jgi:hypothetical protein
MNDHHLILGQLKDVISGDMITDTHDERYRQQIARLLIEQKGYQKKEIQAQFPLLIKVDGKCAQVPVTFVVTIEHSKAMIIHYGPGSLVTRRRPALAMGRLVAACQVPVVVVTNGEDAEILDGATGKIVSKGLDGIPHKDEIRANGAYHDRQKMTPARVQGEARIVMAFEVDDRCPCDDTACILKDH